MPKKIPRPQAVLTPELRSQLAAMDARYAQPRPLRPGDFDLDVYVDDLVAGRTDRPGIVRSGSPSPSNVTTEALNRQAWDAMLEASRHLRRLSERCHWMAELAHADRRREERDAWNRASADASLLPSEVEYTLRETIRRSTDMSEIMAEIGRGRVLSAQAFVATIPGMLRGDGPLSARVSGSAAKAASALANLVESLAALDACHAATAEAQP